jgi:hypothetical protein
VGLKATWRPASATGNLCPWMSFDEMKFVFKITFYGTDFYRPEGTL